MLLVASNASPDLWEPESRPFNHRKSFAAGREEGLHNAGLCFLMVVVRPGNRILGRRWEQILGWMWVGLWSGYGGSQGHLEESWTPLDPGSNLLCSQTQGDIVNPSAQATPGPIHTCQYSVFRTLHTQGLGWDIDTMRGVSNQSCVHVRLVSLRTFRYLCRKQWTRIGPRPVKPHPS